MVVWTCFVLQILIQLALALYLQYKVEKRTGFGLFLSVTGTYICIYGSSSKITNACGISLRSHRKKQALKSGQSLYLEQTLLHS